jgi:hypothetical protein
MISDWQLAVGLAAAALKERRKAEFAEVEAAAWLELLATMADEHVELLLEAWQHDWDDDAFWHADSPARRLYFVASQRVTAKIGTEDGIPPREPDRPLALPPEVAEIYLQHPFCGFWGCLCERCGFRSPVIGEWRPADPAEPGALSLKGGIKWFWTVCVETCPLPSCGGVMGAVLGGAQLSKSARWGRAE